MAMTIHCRDMGADCDFVATGETLEDVLAVGGEHGKEVHGITEIPPEMVEKVKSLVRTE